MQWLRTTQTTLWLQKNKRCRVVPSVDDGDDDDGYDDDGDDGDDDDGDDDGDDEDDDDGEDDDDDDDDGILTLGHMPEMYAVVKKTG